MGTEPAFTTTDVRHAAFLLARGHELIGSDDGTGRLRFSFACSQRDAGAYFSPDDTVSARQLFTAWRHLRNLIDDARNGGSTPRTRSRTDGTYRPAWQDR